MIDSPAEATWLSYRTINNLIKEQIGMISGREMSIELEIESAEEDNRPIPSLPPSLQKYLPRKVLFIDGYLQVPYAGLPGRSDVGSIRVPNNISDAKRECDRLNVSCRAFSFVLNASAANEHAYFKYNLGIPTYMGGRHLYIKTESADDFIRGLYENLTCAVPMISLRNASNEQCALPILDPFDQELMHLVKRRGPMECDSRDVFTALGNNTLRIKEDAPMIDTLDHVIVQPIFRVNESDFHFEIGPKRLLNLTDRSFAVKEDLWKVKSVLKNGRDVTTYHLSVVEKPEVQQRMHQSAAPLDIIMIFFDATSREHFQRMLPMTFKFLAEEMKTHFFKGYSVVGDATTPNLNALLTGKSLDENAKIRDAMRGNAGAGTVDEWPFIFKDLKRLGFSTFWSEDYASIGAFQYRLNGFRDQPVDHYGRPLWLGTGGMCIGGQFQVAMQLEYLKSFMKSYPGRRKFGLTFLCDLTHDHLTQISIADRELATFLRSLRQDNLFNNTMFMVMADHGWRFGEIRNTNQGRLEERMPLLSITLPPWFENQYPEEMRNFVRNKDIVSSPYDIYATFQHLLDFPRQEKRKVSRGISLFKRFPSTRTCADAGITDEWCPCLKWREIEPTHAHVKKGAKAAVSHINGLLSENSLSARLCHQVGLVKIIRAVQKMSTLERMPDLECSYQIQFETKPAAARFEALVRISYTGDALVYGSVSRINRYGSQPACIEKKFPALRKYCYCR